MTRMRINLERLKNNLMEVGAVANAGTAGYTRLAYSAEEKGRLPGCKKRCPH